MRIVIGSDHAGYELKQTLQVFLRAHACEVLDVGTCGLEPVDFPDYAERVALAVRDGAADRGIMLCGSGVGGSVAANKVDGVRAGLCHDIYSARQGVEHDDMNVLVLGSRVIGDQAARELVLAFVGARFSAEPRHARRLAKIQALERG
ncbi:MAG: ribose 5-phosphate isomerase B [Proteobacteria bacterium]|nr:ribose 5-phosphate isomerase B [Pseudomonadota bacterium]